MGGQFVLKGGGKEGELKKPIRQKSFSLKKYISLFLGRHDLRLRACSGGSVFRIDSCLVSPRARKYPQFNSTQRLNPVTDSYVRYHHHHPYISLFSLLKLQQKNIKSCRAFTIFSRTPEFG